MKNTTISNELPEREKLKVLFVDDEIAKVRELLKGITSSSVEIIPFEPFYDTDETFREILTLMPDLIFMDHWLAQGPKKADWDKVIQELVSRWYKWKFITNTGWDVNENFKSVAHLRNDVWERVIIEHANKKPKIIDMLLRDYSRSISLILNIDKIDLITRRTIKEKLLAAPSAMINLTEEEKTFVQDIFWCNSINKKCRLQILLNDEEFILNQIATAEKAEQDIFYEEIKKLAGYWVLPDDSKLLQVIPAEEEREPIQTRNSNFRKNLSKQALEEWYESLTSDEKEELLSEIRKTEYGLTSYSKIRSKYVYWEILSRFNNINDYEKKNILDEMINGDYEAFCQVESEALDWINLSMIESGIAMRIMLRNPSEVHKREFDFVWSYSRPEMDLVALYLTAYLKWAKLPQYLMDKLWEHREKILNFDRFECVGPKPIFAIMSFDQFSSEYDESQKKDMILRILDKWKNKWKISYIREFSTLTWEEYDMDLSLKNIQEFRDYDMDEVFEAIEGKKLVLSKECYIGFIKKQLCKWAHKNVEALFANDPDSKLWIITWEELKSYIKEYSPKNMIELLFTLMEKWSLSLDKTAKEFMLRNYPWISVQIAIEKYTIKKIANYLWVSEKRLKESASSQYKENFNYHMLAKLRKYEWKQDEFKKLFLLSELY